LVGAQLGHAPPQSTSVSVPLRTPSPQVAATHLLALQTPLAQSEGALQPRPSGQGAQALPPQSTSVSVPPFSPSLHPGPTHTSVTAHSPVVQSALVWHPVRTPHCGHAVPPQSLPVSVPLRTPSVQVGEAQRPSPQRRVAQSVAPMHARPSSQGLQLPPQSVSVSAPFFT
jgi:hypothetical protein